VFFHTESGAIQPRWITTGITDGFHTEILIGAEPGHNLITGFRLQAAADQRNRRGSLLGGQQATY
jgi:hypothetical protein